MNNLETERLVIRNFVAEDWEALLKLVVQYGASEFGAYDHQWPQSPEEIKGVTTWFAGGDSFLAVCLKDTSLFIGFVACNPEGENVYNLGYIFNSDYHGQGYATEACRAVLSYVFEQLRATKMITGTAVVNRASCRLLEKLGFTITSEGTGSFQNEANGKPITFRGYNLALTREEWEIAKTSAVS